jgi:hypothetical protein
LSALIILGESLALSFFLLREILAEIAPKLHHLMALSLDMLFPDFYRTGTQIQHV